MKNDTPKISKNREKKAVVVAEVAEKVGRATAMVMTNYQGLTHKQLEELKKTLKPVDAELVVTKNTLLKRAIDEKAGLANPIDQSSFDGPTATLFTYADPMAGLSALTKYVKTNKLPSIKVGIFEKVLLSENEVIKLASLPPKEVLLAQLVGGLKSPIYGLHRALNWNVQKLVMTLNAVSKTKQA